MNYTKDNFIDGFDLESYLDKHAPRPAQPGECVISCPTCGKNKLVVNFYKKTWHCWVCEEYKLNLYGRRKPVAGAGGLIDLIQLLEDCNRERAIAIVIDQSRFMPVDIRALGSKLFVDRGVTVQAAPAIATPLGWKAIDHYDALPYLRQRGITPEDVVSFGLGYCDTGTYTGRLIFPVWEEGKLVYFQARAMWEDPSPSFRKSLNPELQQNMASPADVLMNLDVARGFPRVTLVEGPIDCVHVGASACATFGKKISMTQILKLKRAGVRALDLMWDGPTEREPLGAWPDMMRAASLLSGMFDVRLVFLPRGDPGDYPRGQLDGFRLQAVLASAVSRLAAV